MRLRLTNKPWSRARLVAGKVIRWWLGYDQKYRLKWRAANAAATLLVICSILIPILQANYTNKRYELNSDVLSLVGDNNQALADKLTFDSKSATYQFNKKAIKDYNPLDAVSQQVGSGGKDTKSLYALDVAEDFSKGVTYHDVNSQLSFSLLPQFESLAGKTEQGRIVFPLNGGPQAIYTLKNNGLKEDIVVADNKQDTLRFTYKLNLPKALEAKPLPNGGIGIYSGDPTLFNNMSYGSDSDRQLVEKARENAEKTNLVFGIPTPIITAKDGQLGGAAARFELNDDNLTVVAENLTDIHTAFSIDPSVVVTSTSDFQSSANNEGNIDFSTTDQLRRGMPSGASLSTWSNTGATLSTGRRYGTSVAYNGYIYLIAGENGSNVDTSTVQYALICTGSNNGVQGCGATAGTLGTWSATSSLPAIRLTTHSTAYNGYLYTITGGNSANAVVSDAQYALICTGSNSSVQFGASATAFDSGSDCNGVSTPGSISAWKSTTLPPTPVAAGMIAVYNNYLYLMGGCTGSWINCGAGSPKNLVQRVALQADGSLNATWNSAQTLPTVRQRGTAVASNGYMYIIGGCANPTFSQCTSGAAPSKTTVYAPINADGTFGTWVSGPDLLQYEPQEAPNINIVNGYLYVLNTSGAGSANYSEYAEIHTDGSIGTMRLTNGYSGTAHYQASGAIYNGYAYIIGGCLASAGNCSSWATDSFSAKVSSAGASGQFTDDTTHTFTSGRYGAGSVAYNGYLYVIGGCTAGNCTAVSNKVSYAPIAADGTIGVFTDSGNNISARYGHSVFAYNGHLYVVGGCSSTTTTCSTFNNDVQYSGVITSGNPAGWTTSGNVFTTKRFWQAIAVYADRLYVIGGCSAGDCTTRQKDVQSSAIDASSGDVTGFSTFGDFDASVGRYKLSASANGGYLYITGGYDGTSFKNDVLYAKLNNTGGLSGSWGSAGATFTTARAAHSTVVYNNTLYVVGGCSASIATCTFQSDVQYAAINTNGTIGSFTTAPASLNVARFGAAVTASRGNLYVSGGCSAGSCTTLKQDTEITPLNNGGNGDTQSWTTASGSLAAYTRYRFGTVVYNGYIYVLGGSTTSGVPVSSNIVIYAAIDSDGDVGTFNPTSGYANPQYDAAFIASAGYMYRIGGGGTYVQAAIINSNGTLGTWGTANATGLTAARDRNAVAAYNGYLYSFGGCGIASLSDCRNGFTDTPTNQVESAQITGGGATTGNWTTSATNNMPVALATFQVVQLGEYMYALGGCSVYDVTTGNCTTTSQSVYMAKFDGAGGLADAGCGTGIKWCMQNGFTTARQDFAATIQDGYLYVMGGAKVSVGVYSNDVQAAPIHANGTLGNWVVTSTGFTTGRHFQGGAAKDGTIYMVGGCSGDAANCNGQALNDIQYASPAVTSRRATYSKFIDLGRSTNIRSITYNGSGNPVSFNYRVAGANATFGANTSAASIATTGTCTGNAQATRYIEVIASFDDSATTVYGEAGGSSVTDFTVNFYYTHAPPNLRLRAGQTLTNGDLSPLDTCGTMAP